MAHETRACGRGDAVLESATVTGTVKWFNHSKGYGFVVPHEAGADILVGVKCLRASGFRAIDEGAVVTCQVEQTPDGRRATWINHIDTSNIIPGSRKRTRAYVSVRAESPWKLARVKQFSQHKGYGFLQTPSCPGDIFVHKDMLKQFDSRGLKTGQKVYVRWGFGSKGYMAAVLKPFP